MDGILAILVLITGFVIMVSFFKYAPTKQQSEFFSVDIMDLFSNTKISELSDDYAGASGFLVYNGNITNLENSVLAQTAEFYYRNQTSGKDMTGIIHSFLEHISKKLVPSGFNFMLKLDNKIMYQQSTIPIQKADVIIPSRKIVYAVMNNTELAGAVFVGPYVAEVLTWK